MKIIVAHPFQQHSFKTAVAVKNDGNLCKYVTTVYLKGGTFTSFLSKFLKGDNKKRVNGRKTTELEEDEVLTLCEWTNLLLLFLHKLL